MAHELLTRVLDAQRTNTTLSGDVLQHAAHELVGLAKAGNTVLLTYDGAGDRILGYALALDSTLPQPHDRTQPLPHGATCLLVGGAIAGPIGVAEAAATARQLGASTVHAAILGGWSSDIPGVDTVRAIASAQTTAA